jgi:hypothetical protein
MEYDFSDVAVFQSLKESNFSTLLVLSVINAFQDVDLFHPC